MKKIAIYSRKSKFTGKGESVENQVEICKKYIEMHYGESNISVYEDEGFSAASINRPQFKLLLNDIKNNEIDVLVCYRLDRVSRNVADFSGIVEVLMKKEVDFISVKERFDTSTPMGKAMMYIASVFAQLERETIAERIRDNMLELAKTGRWLGGVTPTGYKSTAVSEINYDGKRKKLFKLETIAEEKELVQLIYDKYLEFCSQTLLEEYLNNNNIKSKNNKKFSRYTLKDILKNPVYAVADKTTYSYFIDRGGCVFDSLDKFDGKRGLMVYNKTIQSGKNRAHKRNIEDWIVAVGKHKGFISGELWVKTQKILNSTCKAKKPYR